MKVDSRERVLDQLHADAGELLHQIADLFKPGAKLTLVVRVPEFPDGTRDVLLTDDTAPEIIKAIEALAKRPERKL